MSELRFRAMGTDIRLLAGAPLHPGLPSAELALEHARRWIQSFDRRLSRFRENSELCRLNADPRVEVPASDVCRAFVRAAVWAAERSRGLVDPTLTGALDAAGYDRSLDDRKAAVRPGGPESRTQSAATATAALRTSVLQRPAQPAADARWRAVRVDDVRRTVLRPPGLRLDSGGVGKGLAADAVAHLLDGYGDVVVDCGGDVRVANSTREADLLIEHPLGCEPFAFAIRDGAVATSGTTRRAWRHDGRPQHHLIDPSTNKPAWTGVIQATAIAPTTLEAETRAKAALLSGPVAAPRFLVRYGGAFYDPDGGVRTVGALDFRQVAA